MDIKAELETGRKKLQDIAQQLQMLDEQKQVLLQEALRLDGEVRVLVRLSKEEVEKQ